MAKDPRIERRAIDLLLRPATPSLVRRGLAAAGLATTLLSASTASAESEVFGDAGVFLGYTWGETGGFTFGVQGRLGVLSQEGNIRSCNDEPAFVAAATSRLM